MTVLALVVAALFVGVVLVGVGDRLRLPWPVLLVLVGTAAAFVPGIDAPDLDPELILPLFLPPLLFATAQRASWSVFRARWRAVLFLAVLLVAVTVAAVGATVTWLIPGIALGSALAVGAAVAPPDPVAVEAVAGPLRMPRRLVGVLQSEGLFNDATALVVFQAAIAATVAGEQPGAETGLLLVWSAVGAVGVGLAAAWLAGQLADRLTDPVAPSALTLVLPFAVYLAADAVEASGVIAVVVAALQMRQRADADDVEQRLTGSAFWNVVEMLVTAAAFALIGLELRAVIEDAGDQLGRMVADAAVVAVVVIAVRAVWMLGALVSVRRRGSPPGTAPRTVAEAAVLTWSGMRGLATLALALALPRVTDDGSPFPFRTELVIIAAGVLVATLVLPGLTLPVLLRVLGVRESEEVGRAAERRLVVRARQAALTELAALDREALGVDDTVGEEVLGELRARFARLGVGEGGTGEAPGDDAADRADYEQRLETLRRRRDQWMRVQSLALAAARREVLAARSEAGVDPEIVDRVLQRLDVRSLASG
ncbi:sodium/proton antiporter (CPA1 family) [Actinomycetospora succinea]|uniref:Sodium/proton antiporter (CPA1 family) n=1 Tax=Actinomycetospora succinea TaxID=663603 RepID=A0A4V3D8A0_9PSEU|nr:Na+/H+ antiporter [Actinomycetospora succinea]TDQ50937.1 sodium/proton antiporter (CPA1 family) [Actinomycetospora succinea]